jgi:lipopolysaccharide transport system permease protein
VLAIGLTGVALGVLLLPLGLLYQDVGRGLALVTGFWLLLTPVAYPPPATGWGAALAQWNPVGPLITTVRGWWLGADTYATAFPIVAVAAAAVLAGAWVVLRIALPHAVARLGS